MTLPPASLTELKCGEFGEYAGYLGEPAYRGGQLRKWVYHNLAGDFEEMTDLPQALRRRLAAATTVRGVMPIKETAGKDGTVKRLYRMADGTTVEAALMFYGGDEEPERRTVCVSTQAGCSIGCPFCATGQQGYERNLTSGEITGQVLDFAGYLQEQGGAGEGSEAKRGGRVSNVVFMGMGEPLANYEALWQSIETLNAPECFGLGARNMTISTAGLAPQILRLAREKLQVGLAVSLHAAENALRNRLVPVNRKYPLEELIAVCREYVKLTGRRISFEYILFEGINDSLKQARELADLVKGLNCHVNLIPANATENNVYRPPAYRAVLAFEEELQRRHVNVTLRERRGQDISAGCGQLRGRYLAGTTGVKKNRRLVKTDNVS